MYMRGASAHRPVVTQTRELQATLPAGHGAVCVGVRFGQQAGRSWWLFRSASPARVMLFRLRCPGEWLQPRWLVTAPQACSAPTHPRTITAGPLRGSWGERSTEGLGWRYSSLEKTGQSDDRNHRQRRRCGPTVLARTRYSSKSPQVSMTLKTVAISSSSSSGEGSSPVNSAVIIVSRVSASSASAKHSASS